MVYNPKTTSLKELEEERNLGVKSKIKFQGDFKEALEELVGKVEIIVKEEIVPNYVVEYTSYGDQIIKIKIKDKSLMIDKLVSCTLFYNKNDKIYGYVTPIFTSSEKGQKPKKYEAPRFSLSNNDKAAKATVKKIIGIIEEF